MQKNKFFAIFLLLLCFVGCGKSKKTETVEEKEKQEVEVSVEEKEEKKLKIINPDSDTRPVAVMINNLPVAVPNHAGLQDAYVTYEILVEGGITRLMAVFKDVNPTKIGAIRSSRPYYLDYALENDAIYTHFGYSEEARMDIESLGINNINGLYDDGFWRDTSLNVAYEHTAFNNMENILNTARNKGYRMTSKEILLNYSVDDVNLNEMPENRIANNVSVRYSYGQTSSYTYDPNNRVYLRFSNGNPHTDGITGQQYNYKNILVLKIENYSYDGYLQHLANIGVGDGFYITNGYAIPIKWEKPSRQGKTIYKDLSGNLISINDGNTFIQIMPIYEELVIN